MAAKKLPAILLLSSILLFTTLIITLTHSGFQCDVDTANGRTQCINFHIDEDKEIVCQGSVFQITAQQGPTDVIILCPWSFWTTLSNFVGVLGGLLFAALIVLQRFQREISTIKFAVRLGAMSSITLVISIIIMGFNISGGYKKCQEFEAALGSASSDTECSIVAFAWDLALMCVGLIALGIESFLEYKKYKLSESNLAKDDDLTQCSDSEFHVRFFADN